MVTPTNEKNGREIEGSGDEIARGEQGEAQRERVGESK